MTPTQLTSDTNGMCPVPARAESEKRLIKKCRELNAEIVANAAKVQTALKLSEEDQNTIQALKKEIEKAWKMVDASHEKVSRTPGACP